MKKFSYSQKFTATQLLTASNAVSIFDSSSQSEALQRKADMANNAAQRAEAPRPNNTGMPDNLKSAIESLSGFSMDDVRVHYNSSKPATVQALAYTQGTDIHVAPGQEKHLPHEAWHVAQQMAGRVSPTTNINGMPVNDNTTLEHEADVMGEKAAQCKENCAWERNYGSNKSSNNIFQLMNVKCLIGSVVRETKEINTYRDLCDFLTSHKPFLSVDLGNGEQEQISKVKKKLKESLNVDDVTLGRETYGQIDISRCVSIDAVVNELIQHQIPAAPIVAHPPELLLWNQDWENAKDSISGFTWKIHPGNCCTDVKDASSLGVAELKHKSHGKRNAGGLFVTTAFFVVEPEMRLYAVGRHVKGFPARYKILWVNRNIGGNPINTDDEYDL